MSGVTLLAGVVTAFSEGFAARAPGEKALTLAGISVLALAWLGVVRAALSERAGARRT